MPSPEPSPKKVRVDVVEYTLGQDIIREGDPGDCAYILLKGEVEVLKKNQSGKEVVIAILGANEIFGEMCLFDETSHRSATIRVMSDRAQVMEISRQYFQSHLDSLPESVHNIINVMVERLRRADTRIVLLS